MGKLEKQWEIEKRQGKIGKPSRIGVKQEGLELSRIFFFLGGKIIFILEKMEFGGGEIRFFEVKWIFFGKMDIFWEKLICFGGK